MYPHKQRQRSVVEAGAVHTACTHPTFSVRVAAKETRKDVVLIDTAGRMQNNEPLMRSLAKVRVQTVFRVYTDFFRTRMWP